VASLQERYAVAARKEAEGTQSAEKTEALVAEIKYKIQEIASAKADKSAVDQALNIKADKDSVARDTEANQRAVDAALSTMNAGTQGIQQLLERQEGQVSDLERQFQTKPDRDELERIREQLDQVSVCPHPSVVCTVSSVWYAILTTTTTAAIALWCRLRQPDRRTIAALIRPRPYMAPTVLAVLKLPR
jgi:hypothetical protein